MIGLYTTLKRRFSSGPSPPTTYTCNFSRRKPLTIFSRNSETASRQRPKWKSHARRCEPRDARCAESTRPAGTPKDEPLDERSCSVTAEVGEADETVETTGREDEKAEGSGQGTGGQDPGDEAMDKENTSQRPAARSSQDNSGDIDVHRSRRPVPRTRSRSRRLTTRVEQRA